MRPQVKQGLSWFFITLGFVLLGVGGYGFFASPPAPALEVAEINLEITGCVAGGKRDVVLHLDNRSRHPIRIVGLATC